jgi:uncharacterized protein with beta-barrel porin domain
LVAFLGTFASAQTTSFISGSGDFNTGANWSGGVPPSATLGAVIDNNATITVNSTATSLSLAVDGGNTVSISGPATLTVVGETPGVASQDVLIDNGSTLTYAGNLTFNNGIFLVGETGTGTLNLTTGTLNYDVQTTADDTQLAIGHGTNSVGTFNQSGNSIVDTGQSLFIGSLGGNGNYNLSGSAALNIGTPGNPQLSSYFVAIGSNQFGLTPEVTGQASTGILTISNSSTFTLGPGAFLDVGTAIGTIGNTNPPPAGFLGGTGTITQNGAGSVVTFQNGSNADFGGFDGGVGVYNLQAGTLNIGTTASSAVTIDFGVVANASGTLNQTGGSLTLGMGSGSDSQLIIGDSGTGLYQLSGSGQATINNELILGNATGSVGTLTQTGGTLSTAATISRIIIGNNGTGIYNLEGGTATFLHGFNVGGVTGTTGSGFLNQSGGTLIAGSTTTFPIIGGATGTATGQYNLSGGSAIFDGGLAVGATGVVNQTGGTLQIASGQLLDMITPGGSYNLNGGTLQVGANGLFGSSGDGTLNFGGGTLQALSGGTLVDGLSGSVSGTSILNTGSGNITITGTLTGSGGFNLIGGGTVSLNTDTALYSGTTTISGSTLALTVPDATDTFSSPIAGSSGNFNIDFTTANSTLVLPGKQNFTGATTIGANGTSGTLQVFSGILGSVGQGATGAGSLIVGQAGGGSGTFQLEGANTFTGTTTVNPGFKLLANGLDSTTVTNTGTLASNASVGTVFNVGVGGTGFLNTQAGGSNGTIDIRVNGPVFDSFQTGSANLFGTVAVSGFSALGTRQDTIVTTAPGALTTGTLNSNSATGLNAISTAPVLLQVSLSESLANGKLFLNVTQLPISQFAATPNQVAVANSLDGILSAPPPGAAALFTAIDSLSAAQIPDALDQLSPRGYLYMRDIAFENSTFMAEKVDGFMANIRNGFSGVDTSGLSLAAPGFDSSLGRSLGSLLAFNNEGPAPDGVNYYPESPDSSPLSPPHSGGTTPSSTISDTSESYTAPGNAAGANPNFDFSRFTEFVSGNVMLGDLGQNQNSANNEQKATTVAGSATAGIGFRMTSNLSAGILMDYNHTDATTDSLGSHVRVDTYSPGVFATFFERGFYVNALGAFGFDNYSNERELSFGGTSAQATSSPNGRQYTGNLDFGYDFHPEHHWIFGPTLGVQYTHLDVDSFQESGAGPADLSVNSQSADSLRTRLGGHVIYQIRSGSILFQPNITASWQHEFLNDPFGLTSQFDIPNSSPFTIQGSGPGRDSAVLGFGLTATLDNSMNLYLEYLAEVGGENYFVQSIEGGVKASF